MNIILEQTCLACPEQYDVYIDDECLGYMRLRHGFFYAEYRDKRVYETTIEDDAGIFLEEEREIHLPNAKSAIIKAHEEYLNK